MMILFYTTHIQNQLGVKLLADKVIESHTPLLDQEQVKRLDGLSKGLNLNQPDNQKIFLITVDKMKLGMSTDHMLEYLVNNRDLPVGNVISAVRLSPDCNAARRIHWGAEQIRRHKERSGRPAAMQVSKEMAGSRS